MTCEEEFSERLGKVLKGISAPIATKGTITLDTEPSITLKEDGNSFSIHPESSGTVGLERQAETLKGLTGKMPRALFGYGTETVHDPAIRDALQMKSDDFDVNIPEEALESVMVDIKKGLKLETDIVLEPYSLNVYGKGGRFVKHKDTPRRGDMLGTLVLCLPSLFTGGDLEVSMGNEKASYFVRPNMWPDGDSEGGCYEWYKNPPNAKVLLWCAFFADVDHEIKRVAGGLRITLAYLIRRKDSQSASAQRPREIRGEEQANIIKEVMKDAVEDESFLASGGKIGFPCMHLYTNKEVFPTGKDRILYPRNKSAR